jgi:hypothetical protein
MSEKKALCTGRVYRGVVIILINTNGLSRAVVIGTANRQAVQLYECADYAEACALVDAALRLTTDMVLPVREEDGGARAVGVGNGSMLSEYDNTPKLSEV